MGNHLYNDFLTWPDTRDITGGCKKAGSEHCTAELDMKH